jgi:protein-S-isoprenylcysteine O-methyltransferase Ste14
MQISEITKTIVNVATLIVSVGTLVLHYTTGFLPANVAVWISVIVGIAGAIVHYLAPNTTTDPTIAKTQSVRLRKSHATKAAA